MPRNFQHALLRAKAEVSDGVDPTLANADAIRLFDVAAPTRRSVAQRERPKVAVAGAHLEGMPRLKPVGHFYELTTTHELRGTRDGNALSLTNLPELAPYYAGAGMALQFDAGTTRTTVRPASRQLGSFTEDLNIDGIVYKALGCRTRSLKLAWTAGEPIMMEVARIGLWQPVGESVLNTAGMAFGVAEPAIVENLAFTLGGSNVGEPIAFECSWEQAIADNRRSANGAGVLRTPQVVGRRITWSLTLEEPLPSAKDFEAMRLSGALQALAWLQNAGSYQGIEFFGRGQIHTIESSPDADIPVVKLSGECFHSAPTSGDAAFLTHR